MQISICITFQATHPLFPLLSPGHMASISPLSSDRYCSLFQIHLGRVSFHGKSPPCIACHVCFRSLGKINKQNSLFFASFVPFSQFPFSSFSLTFHHPSLSYCMIENSFQCAPSPHPLSLKWNEQLLAASMG